MSTRSAMWVIGIGALSAAVGFQFGSLSAAPPVPVDGSAVRAAPQEFTVPAAVAVDMAELASQLREELGHSRLHVELGASLRHELGEELRAAIEEQFAQVLPSSDPTRTAASAQEPLTEEERQTRERAFEAALLALDDVQARGRFDPRSRDELRELLPEIGPDEQYEVIRRLSVALNQGAIEFDDPSELPLF